MRSSKCIHKPCDTSLTLSKPKQETTDSLGNCTFDDPYLPLKSQPPSLEKTQPVNKKAKSTPTSAAVKSLSKASTQGMKKLSVFFTKK